MRIEDITKKRLESEKNENALKLLRMRMIEIYNRYFKDTELEKAEKINLGRKMLCDKYMLLKQEMRKRALPIGENPLDREIFDRLTMKSVWGLDVPGMGEAIIQKDYASIVGSFIKNPKRARKVDVVIKDSEENRNEELEAVIAERVKMETGKDRVEFTYSPDGPEENHIPIFDRVLKAKERTEKVDKDEEFDISKPYPNEHACRKRDPGDFKPDSFRRVQRTSGGKRYSIIMGRLKGETTMTEQAYRYPKKTWSESVARSHCKDHDGRFEAASNKADKQEYECECLECGHKIKSEEHCSDVECPKCGGEMRRAERPGPGKARVNKAEDGKIVVTIWRLPEERIENERRELAAKIYNDIQLPGDVEAVFGKMYGSKYETLTAIEFPADRWSGQEVKDWLVKYGISTYETPELTTAKMRFIQKDKKEQIVGGIIYEPDVEDVQGDKADAETIREAMYDFMMKYAVDQNRINVNHKGKTYTFPIIEAFQPEEDTKKGKETVKAGSWFMTVKVTSKDIWKKVESGELTGFSMEGMAAS